MSCAGVPRDRSSFHAKQSPRHRPNGIRPEKATHSNSDCTTNLQRVVQVCRRSARIENRARRRRTPDASAPRGTASRHRGPLPPKANVLAIGPSGTGKTYSCQLLSKILGLPFAAIDVSQVTASGYIGDDLSGVLYLLVQAASQMGVNPEQGGVIFLDEIDKISRTSYESATTVGVQYEALRLLDGGEVSFPSTGLNKWGGSGATMNTAGLLVVASALILGCGTNGAALKQASGSQANPSAG